jgi:hypothetical protein
MASIPSSCLFAEASRVTASMWLCECWRDRGGEYRVRPAICQAFSERVWRAAYNLRKRMTSVDIRPERGCLFPLVGRGFALNDVTTALR